MALPQSAADFYRTQQRLQLVLVAAGRRAWARMLADFDASWAAIAPGLVGVASAAQLASATAATAYVPAVLAETGQPDAPEARVRPQAFAGIAADGRGLDGLLQGAVVTAKRASGAGAPPADALAQGGRWLDALLQGVVTDAGRGATQAEVAVRPHMGFVRMVNPPCCGRCAILAGRWYAYDAGFRRHPRCDCTAIPSTRDGWERLSISPAELFANGHVKGLTQRETDRLAAGEDRNKVINASRDMWRARIAEQKAADQARRDSLWAGATSPRPTVGIEDLLASLTSRVEALGAMKAQGYAA